MYDLLAVLTVAVAILGAPGAENPAPQAARLVVTPGEVSVIYGSPAQAQAVVDALAGSANASLIVGPDGHVRARLEPDSARTDARYAVLSPVSGGWLVYAPDLIPVGEAFSIEAPFGWSIVPSAPSRHNGLIYVGPLELEAPVIIDDGVPDWFASAIRESINETAGYFESVLAKPSYQPLWVISGLPVGAHEAYVADVAQNAVVHIQLSEGLSPRYQDEIRFMVAHETFHLHAQSLWDEGSLRDWEREGAAEFAAVTYFIDIGETELAYHRLGQHVNDCFRRIPAGGLSGLETQEVRYSCGTLYAWLSMLDLAAKQDDTDLFEVLRNGQGRFPARESNQTTIGAALEAMWNGRDGIESLVHAALLEAGVSVAVREPLAVEWAGAALGPAVFAACPGIDGLSAENDGSWLIHGDAGCQGTGRNTNLITVGGKSVSGREREVFEDVAEHCQAGIELLFRGEAGEAFGIYRCETAPTAPRSTYTIVEAQVADAALGDTLSSALTDQRQVCWR